MLNRESPGFIRGEHAKSDLTKHPETEGHAAIELMMILAMGGHLSTPHRVREFIEGIN